MINAVFDVNDFLPRWRRANLGTEGMVDLFLTDELMVNAENGVMDEDMEGDVETGEILLETQTNVEIKRLRKVTSRFRDATELMSKFSSLLITFSPARYQEMVSGHHLLRARDVSSQDRFWITIQTTRDGIPAEIQMTQFDKSALANLHQYLSVEAAQAFMHYLPDAGRSEVHELKDPALIAQRCGSGQEISRLLRYLEQKLPTVQILYDGVDHFSTLIVDKHELATLFDSLGKSPSASLPGQLQLLLGTVHMVSMPAIDAQHLGTNNCLCNAAVIATDFKFGREEFDEAQYAAGEELREWFRKIVVGETRIAAAPRQRGAGRLNPPMTCSSHEICFCLPDKIKKTG